MELLKLTSILTILTFSCATSSSNKDVDSSALDIKEKPSEKQLVSKSGNGVKAEAVFTWQQYFKSPPSSKDRAKLQKTVDGLRKASTTEDLLKRARNEVALGQFAAAEATYREALRQDRKNLDALIELATVYHRTKNSESCLQVLSDVKDVISAQENPDRMRIFRYRYILALANIQRGDRDRGHEILSDLIGQEKTFVPGYAALASSYIATGKDQVARFIVERGLDRGQDDPTLYNILGVIEERNSKTSVARDHYNKAISLNDSFAPALVNRGNLYLKSKEFKMAETDLKKALEVDPLNTDAMISMTAVYRQTGRIDQAKNLAQRILDITPDSAEARFNLALIMRDNVKNQTEALRLFNEVVQTEKANPELKSLAKSAIDELKTIY